MDWVAMMDDMRALCHEFGFPEPGYNFPYDVNLHWAEQYTVFVKETIFELVLALVAVFIVVTLLLANFSYSFLTMGISILISIDLFGLIWWWGLTVNTITVMWIMMSIGLSVDYTAHIIHSELRAK